MNECKNERIYEWINWMNGWINEGTNIQHEHEHEHELIIRNDLKKQKI